MMIDRRQANKNWNPADADGNITWERVDTALLMDIRDELQRLNRIIGCPNFVGIPATLRAIQRNTTKKKRQPKKEQVISGKTWRHV